MGRSNTVTTNHLPKLCDNHRPNIAPNGVKQNDTAQPKRPNFCTVWALRAYSASRGQDTHPTTPVTSVIAQRRSNTHVRTTKLPLTWYSTVPMNKPLSLIKSASFECSGARGFALGGGDEESLDSERRGLLGDGDRKRGERHRNNPCGVGNSQHFTAVDKIIGGPQMGWVPTDLRRLRVAQTS